MAANEQGTPQIAPAEDHSTQRANPQPERPKTRRPNYNQVHSKSLPVTVYPLPAFIPNHPLSLLRLAYVFLSHLLFPPSSHPKVLYKAYFSSETRSIHVTDPATNRALWEQGFFGKGTLSRSEPKWLEGEMQRLGLGNQDTSEEHTRKRREERKRFKEERAWEERQAIEEQLKREAEEAAEKLEARNIEADPNQGTVEPDVSATNDKNNLEQQSRPNESASLYTPPSDASDSFSAKTSSTDVPLEDLKANSGPSFLSWPNNQTNGSVTPLTDHSHNDSIEDSRPHFLSWPNSAMKVEKVQQEHIDGNTKKDMMKKSTLEKYSGLNFLSWPNSHTKELAVSPLQNTETLEDEQPSHSEIDGTLSENTLTESSPEKVTVDDSEVHFPDYSNAYTNGSAKTMTQASEEPHVPDATQATVDTSGKTEVLSQSQAEEDDELEGDIDMTVTNQEHLQLTLPEAFFLHYGLGVLDLEIPNSRSAPSTRDLLTLFRCHSSFPPVSPSQLAPDDTFMLSYVVYHHFRSLGWVVRPGMKFGVDYLLYNRGPVFAHAAYAIMIIPAYTDPYWTDTEERRKETAAKTKNKDWWWLHCVNRVQTQVIKTLVLTYVEVPGKDRAKDAEQRGDVGSLLKQYKVREVVIRRWVPQRNLK